METKSDGAQVKAQQQDPQTAESRPSASRRKKPLGLRHKAFIAVAIAAIFAVVPLYVLATDSGDTSSDTADTELVESTPESDTADQATAPTETHQEEAPAADAADNTQSATEEPATTPDSEPDTDTTPQSASTDDSDVADNTETNTTEEPSATDDAETEYASERTPVGTILGTQSVDEDSGEALLTTQATSDLTMNIFAKGYKSATAIDNVVAPSETGSLLGTVYDRASGALVENATAKGAISSQKKSYKLDGTFVSTYITNGNLATVPPYHINGYRPIGYVWPATTIYNLSTSKNENFRAKNVGLTADWWGGTQGFADYDSDYMYQGTIDGYITWQSVTYTIEMYDVKGTTRTPTVNATWDATKAASSWPSYVTGQVTDSSRWVYYRDKDGEVINKRLTIVPGTTTPGDIMEATATDAQGNSVISVPAAVDVNYTPTGNEASSKTIRLRVGTKVTYLSDNNGENNDDFAARAVNDTGFVFTYQVRDVFGSGTNVYEIMNGDVSTNVQVSEGTTLTITGADDDTYLTANFTIAGTDVNGAPFSVSASDVRLKLIEEIDDSKVVAKFSMATGGSAIKDGSGNVLSSRLVDRDQLLSNTFSSISVTADSGYAFNGWKVYEYDQDSKTRGAEVTSLSGDKTSQSWPTTVMMSQPYEFEAQFLEKPKVYIQGGSYGAVTTNGSTALAASYAINDFGQTLNAQSTKPSNIVVSVTDSSKWEFNGWKVFKVANVSGTTVTKGAGVAESDLTVVGSSLTAADQAWPLYVKVNESLVFEAQYTAAASASKITIEYVSKYLESSSAAPVMGAAPGNVDPSGSGYIDQIVDGASFGAGYEPPIAQTEEQSKTYRVARWGFATFTAKGATGETVGYQLLADAAANGYYTDSGNKQIGTVIFSTTNNVSNKYTAYNSKARIAAYFVKIANAELVVPSGFKNYITGGSTTVDLQTVSTGARINTLTDQSIDSNWIKNAANVVPGSSPRKTLSAGDTIDTNGDGVADYTFKGWFSDPSAQTGKVEETVFNIGDAGTTKTFTAVFEKINLYDEYQVHLNVPDAFKGLLAGTGSSYISVEGGKALNSGTGPTTWSAAQKLQDGSNKSISSAIGSTYTVAGKRYHFDGWYADDGVTKATATTTVPTTQTGSSQTLTYTAKFTQVIAVYLGAINGSVAPKSITEQALSTTTGSVTPAGSNAQLTFTPNSGYELPATIEWYVGDSSGPTGSVAVDPFTTAVTDDTYYWVTFPEEKVIPKVSYTINRFYERAEAKNGASGTEAWWQPAADNGVESAGNAGTEDEGTSKTQSTSAADAAAHLPSGFSASDYSGTTTTDASDPTTVTSITLTDGATNAINIYYKRKTSAISATANPSTDTDLRDAKITTGSGGTVTPYGTGADIKRGEELTLSGGLKTGATLTWVITDGDGNEITTVPTNGKDVTWTTPSGDDGVDKLVFTATWEAGKYDFTIRGWDVTGTTLTATTKPIEADVSGADATKYLEITSGKLAYGANLGWTVATGMKSSFPSNYEVVGYAVSQGGSAYSSTNPTINVASGAINDLATWQVDATTPSEFHIVVYYRTALHDVTYNLDATVGDTSSKLSDLVQASTAGTSQVQDSTAKTAAGGAFVDPVYTWKSSLSDAVKAKYSTTGKPDGAPKITWHLGSATGTVVSSPKAYLEGLSGGLKDDVSFYAVIGSDAVNQYTITFQQPGTSGSGWLGSSTAEKAAGYTVSHKVDFGTTVGTAFVSDFPAPEPSDSTSFNDKWEISTNGTNFNGKGGSTYYTAAEIKALVVDGTTTIGSNANYNGNLYIRPVFDQASVQIQVIKHFQKADGSYTTEAVEDAKKKDGSSEANYELTVGAYLGSTTFTNNAADSTKKATSVPTGINPKYYQNYSSGAITSWSSARAQKAGDSSSYVANSSTDLTVTKADRVMHVFYDLKADYTVTVQWDVANKYMGDAYGGTAVTLDAIASDLNAATPTYTWSDTKTAGGAAKNGAASVPNTTEAPITGVVSATSGYRLGSTVLVSDKYQKNSTVVSGAKRNHYVFLGYIVKYPDGTYAALDAPAAGSTATIALDESKLGDGAEVVITGMWQRDYIKVSFKPGTEGTWSGGATTDKVYWVKYGSVLNNAMTVNDATSASGAVTISTLSGFGLTQASGYETYKHDGTWKLNAETTTKDAATVVGSSVTAETTWTANWDEGATIKYLPGDHGTWDESTETYPNVSTGKSYFDPADYGGTALTALSIKTYADFASVAAGTAGGIEGGNKDDATKVAKGYDLVGWYWDDNGTGRYTYIVSDTSLDRGQRTIAGKTYTYASMPEYVGERGYTFTALYREQSIGLQVNLTESGLNDSTGNAIVNPQSVALATGTGAYGSSSITIPGTTTAYSVIASSDFSKVKADSTMDVHTIATTANTKFVLPSASQVNLKGYTLSGYIVQQRSENTTLDASLRKTTVVDQDSLGNWYVEMGNENSVIIRAEYKPIEYTVTYEYNKTNSYDGTKANLQGAASLNSIAQGNIDSLVAKPASTKANYGTWNATDSTPAVGTITFDNSLSLTAASSGKYEFEGWKYYTIAGDSTLYKLGEGPIAADASKAGQFFVGADVTVYGTWKVKTVNVEFDVSADAAKGNGSIDPTNSSASGAYTQQVAFGDVPTPNYAANGDYARPFPNPQTGYVFAGWEVYTRDSEESGYDYVELLTSETAPFESGRPVKKDTRYIATFKKDTDIPYEIHILTRKSGTNDYEFRGTAGVESKWVIQKDSSGKQLVTGVGVGENFSLGSTYTAPSVEGWVYNANATFGTGSFAGNQKGTTSLTVVATGDPLKPEANVIELCFDPGSVTYYVARKYQQIDGSYLTFYDTADGGESTSIGDDNKFTGNNEATVSITKDANTDVTHKAAARHDEGTAAGQIHVEGDASLWQWSSENGGNTVKIDKLDAASDDRQILTVVYDRPRYTFEFAVQDNAKWTYVKANNSCATDMDVWGRACWTSANESFVNAYAKIGTSTSRNAKVESNGVAHFDVLYGETVTLPNMYNFVASAVGSFEGWRNTDTNTASKAYGSPYIVGKIDAGTVGMAQTILVAPEDAGATGVYHFEGTWSDRLWPVHIDADYYHYSADNSYVDEVAVTGGTGSSNRVDIANGNYFTATITDNSAKVEPGYTLTGWKYKMNAFTNNGSSYAAVTDWAPLSSFTDGTTGKTYSSPKDIPIYAETWFQPVFENKAYTIAYKPASDDASKAAFDFSLKGTAPTVATGYTLSYADGAIVFGFKANADNKIGANMAAASALAVTKTGAESRVVAGRSVPSNTPKTNKGYTFQGWHVTVTKADGTTTKYTTMDSDSDASFTEYATMDELLELTENADYLFEAVASENTYNDVQFNIILGNLSTPGNAAATMENMKAGSIASVQNLPATDTSLGWTNSWTTKIFNNDVQQFDSNGGVPVAPEISGYTFSGWYAGYTSGAALASQLSVPLNYSSTIGDALGSNDKKQDAIQVYAYYVPQEVEVNLVSSLHNNLTAKYSSEKIYVGDKLDIAGTLLPSALEETGYHFAGWSNYYTQTESVKGYIMNDDGTFKNHFYTASDNYTVVAPYSSPAEWQSRWVTTSGSGASAKIVNNIYAHYELNTFNIQFTNGLGVGAWVDVTVPDALKDAYGTEYDVETQTLKNIPYMPMTGVTLEVTGHNSALDRNSLGQVFDGWRLVSTDTARNGNLLGTNDGKISASVLQGSALSLFAADTSKGVQDGETVKVAPSFTSEATVSYNVNGGTVGAGVLGTGFTVGPDGDIGAERVKISGSGGSASYAFKIGDNSLTKGSYTNLVPQNNQITRTGYTFTGWNTQANGQGQHYDYGQEVKLTDSQLDTNKGITLYAEWGNLFTLYQVTPYFEELNADGSFKEFKAGTSFYIGSQSHNWVANADTNQALLVQAGDESVKSGQTKNLDAAKAYMASAFSSAIDGYTLAESQADIDAAAGSGSSYTFMGSITADGTGNRNEKALKLYYTRDAYTLTYAYDFTSGSPSANRPTVPNPTDASVTYKWGQPVTLRDIATNDPDDPSANSTHAYFDRVLKNTVQESWAVTYPDSGGTATAANTAGTFTMPKANATATLTWTPAKVKVEFKVRTVKANSSNPGSGQLLVKNGSTVDLTVADSTTVQYEEVAYGQHPTLTLTTGAYAGDVVSAEANNVTESGKQYRYYFQGWQWTDDTGALQTTADLDSIDIWLADSTKDALDNANVMTLTALFLESYSVNYENNGYGTFVTSDNATNVANKVVQQGLDPSASGIDTASPMTDDAYGWYRNGDYIAPGTASDPGSGAVKEPLHKNGVKFVGWKILGTNYNDAVSGGISQRIQGVVPVDGENPTVPNGYATLSSAALNGIYSSKINQNLTFTALWEEMEYKATFVADDFTANASSTAVFPNAGVPSNYDRVSGTNNTQVAATFKFKADINTPTPTRTGYTFDGWKGSDGSSYSATDSMTMPAENVTYTAQWKVASGSVQYAVDSASAGLGTVAPASENVGYINSSTTDKDAAGATATPKEGYEFDKWTAGNATTAVNASWVTTGASGASTIVPQRNSDGVFDRVTYYAHFKPKDYTLQFKLASGITSAQAVISGTYALPQNYEFLKDIPASQVLLTTNWKVDAKTGYTEASTWQVTMDAVPEWAYDTYKSQFNSTATVTDNADGTKKIVDTVADPSTLKLLGNTVFTKDLVANAVKIEFDTMGGSTGVSEITGVAGETGTWTVPDLSASDKPGYRFLGWIYDTQDNARAKAADLFLSTSPAYGKDPKSLTGGDITASAPADNDVFDMSAITLRAGTTNTITTLPTEDHVYYAVWVPKWITITYTADAEDGTNPDGTPSTPDISQSTWYSTSKLSTLPGTTFAAKDKEGLPAAGQVFQYWQSNDYQPAVAEDETTTVQRAEPGKGKETSAGNAHSEKFTIPTTDVTWHAKWTTRTVKLILDANGGNYGSQGSVVTIEQPWGSSYILPLVAGDRAAGAAVSPLGDYYFSPQEGYKFTGWYSNRNKAKPTTGEDADWMLTPADGEDFQLNATNYVMRTGTATEAVRDEVHLYATWDVEGKTSADLSYPVKYQSTDPVTGEHAWMSELNMVVYDDMTTTTNLYKGSSVPTKYSDIAGQLKFEGWVLTKTSGGTSGETLISDSANMSFEDAAKAAGYARDGGDGEFQGLEDGLVLTEKWSWDSFDVVFHNGWVSPDIIVGDRPNNLTYDLDTTSNVMPKCSWTNYGKKFVQWRTGTPDAPHSDSDTGKAEFKADSAQGKNTMQAYVQEDGKVHLYAMWEASDDTYTLVFVNNKTTKGTEGASVDIDAYNEDNAVKANWTILPRVGYTGYLSNVQTTVPTMSSSDRPTVDGTQLDASYTFTGWFTQKNGKGAKVDDAALSATALRDIVDDQYKAMIYSGSKTVYLYAQWENTGLTIDYDLGSIDGSPVAGTPPASQSGSFNARGQADFTMATTGVTVDGYTADHWEVDFLDGNGTVSVNPGETKTVTRNAAEGGNVGAAVTATMVWVKTPQVLRYDYQLGDEKSKGWAREGMNAGSLITVNTLIDWFSDNLEASLTEQPYRYGYTAKDGWYKSATGNDKYDSTETFGDLAIYQGQTSVPNASNPTKLYKQWTPNEFTVHYDPDGGTPTSSAGWYTGRDKTGVKFTDKNLVPSQNAIEKTGYQFKGWYYEDGDGLRHYVAAETKAGTETDPTYGSIAVAVATTTSSPTGDKTVSQTDEALKNDGSITLHAEWEEDGTTIIWETPDSTKAQLVEDGTTDNVDRITKSVGSATGDGVVVVTAVPKPGYRITDWTETKAGHGTVSLGEYSSVITSHLDELDDDGLYKPGNDGSWTIDLSKYANGNGGSGGTSLWVDATYAPEVVPMNTTYTVKFYKKDADTGKYVLQASDTLPASGSKLIAMNESTVKYDDSGIDDGKAASKYTVDGYKFIVGSVSGVDSEDNAVSNQNQKKLTGNVATDELRLFYEPLGKNITYAYNEPGKRAGVDYPASTEQVAMPASQVAMVGQTVTTDDLADWSPSVIGWTFKGWKTYSADGGTNASDIDDGFTMPNDDVIVYAEWERNTVEVTILGDIEVDPYDDPGADDAWVNVTDFPPSNKIAEDESWTALAPFGSVLTTKDYEEYSTPYFKAKIIGGLKSADPDDTATHEVSVSNYTKGSFVLTWKYEYTSGPDSLDEGKRTGSVGDPSSLPLTGNITLQPVLSKIHVVEYLPGDSDPTHGGVHGTWKNDLANTGNVGRDKVTSGKTKYTDIPTVDAGYSIIATGDEPMFQFDSNQVGRDGQPPHEAGYKFMGWAYLDKNGDEHVAGGQGNVSVNLTNLDYSVIFVAMWEATEQRVYLDSNGATNKTYSPEDIYAAAYTGDTVELPHDLTRPGFTFGGWGQYDDEGNLVKSWGTDADLAMPGEDISLKAIWQATSVAIEYQASRGGTITGATSEVLKSDAVTAAGSSAAAEPGYKFSKWTKNSDPTDLGFPASAATPAGPFANGDTFTANFVPIDYLVVFNDVDTEETDEDARATVLGGSALRNGDDQLVAFGDKVNSGYDKTTDKPYLVFTNPNFVEPLPKPWKVETWLYDESEERPETDPDIVMYTDDLDEVVVQGYTEITPYARMVKGDYTVRFETFAGGTAYTDLHVKASEYNLAAGKTPKRTGYEFKGWAYKGGEDDGWTDWTSGSGHHDNWTAGSGADYTSDMTYEWVAKEIDPDNSPTSITLYAKWSLLSDLVVNYDMDGGDPVVAHDTDKYGSADNKLTDVTYTDADFGSVYDEDDAPNGVLDAAPTKTGYFFTGWKLKKADGSGLVDNFTVGAEDFGTLAETAGDADATEITLVAQWKPLLYEVWFYNSDHDAEPAQKSSDIGLDVSLTTNNFNTIDPPSPRNTRVNGGTAFKEWLYKPSAGGEVTVTNAMTFEEIANDTSVSLVPDADGNPPHINLYATWDTLAVYYNEYHLLTADPGEDEVSYSGTYTDTYGSRAVKDDPTTEAEAKEGKDPYTLKQWAVFTGTVSNPQTTVYSTAKKFPGFTLVSVETDPIVKDRTPAMRTGSDTLASTANRPSDADGKVSNATKFVFYYKENINYRVQFQGNEGDVDIPSSIPSDDDEKQGTEWKDRLQKSWTSTGNIPDDPTRPGYTFSGWSNTPDQSDGYMPTQTGAEAEQGEVVNDENNNKNLQLGELTYSSPTEEDDPEDNTVVLYANWNENQANITYRVVVDDQVNATTGGKIKLNDGSDTMSAEQRTESPNAVTGSAYGASAEADDGYTFKHWRLDEAHSEGVASNVVKANGTEGELQTSSILDGFLGLIGIGGSDDAVLATQAGAVSVAPGQLVNVGQQYTSDDESSMMPGYEVGEFTSTGTRLEDYNIYAQAVYSAVFVANESATINYWPNPQAGDNAADMRSSYPYSQGEGLLQGQTVKILDNEYTSKYYTFAGWNTKPDGTGDTYQPGDSYKIPVTDKPSDLPLYAQWTPKKFNVDVLASTDKEGGTVPATTVKATYGDQSSLSSLENYPHKAASGRSFLGWKVTYVDPTTGKTVTQHDLYTGDLADLKIQGNTTIEAVWGNNGDAEVGTGGNYQVTKIVDKKGKEIGKITVDNGKTVTFLDADDKVLAVKAVKKGKVVAPDPPKIKGKVFVGWMIQSYDKKGNATVKAVYKSIKTTTTTTTTTTTVTRTRTGSGPGGIIGAASETIGGILVKTGDNAPILICVAALALAGVGLIALRRRKEDEEEQG